MIIINNSYVYLEIQKIVIQKFMEFKIEMFCMCVIHMNIVYENYSRGNEGCIYYHRIIWRKSNQLPLEK